MSEYFYLDSKRERQGPVDLDALKGMAGEGKLRPDDLIWTEEWADWQEAKTLAGLFDASQIAPPTQPDPNSGQKAPGPWSIPAMPPAGYTPGMFEKLFKWWLWLLVGGLISILVGFLTAFIGIGFLFIFLGYLAVIAGAVFGYILLYKWWRQIQDGHARTGPGKAVGFMFIPLFNIYWIFIVIRGLALDLGGFIDRHSVQAEKPNAGLALTFCILVLCGIIPIVNIIAGLANMVIGIILFVQFHRASKAIAAHLTQ